MQLESNTFTSEASITAPPRSRLLAWPLSEHLIKVVSVGLMIFDGALAALLLILAYWMRNPEEVVFIGPRIDLGFVSFLLPNAFHPKFDPYLSVLYFAPFVHIGAFWYRG
jgi:hypothetical protein